MDDMSFTLGREDIALIAAALRFSADKTTNTHAFSLLTLEHRLVGEWNKEMRRRKARL